MILNVKQVK